MCSIKYHFWSKIPLLVSVSSLIIKLQGEDSSNKTLVCTSGVTLTNQQILSYPKIQIIYLTEMLLFISRNGVYWLKLGSSGCSWYYQLLFASVSYLQNLNNLPEVKWEVRDSYWCLLILCWLCLLRTCQKLFFFPQPFYSTSLSDFDWSL